MTFKSILIFHTGHTIAITLPRRRCRALSQMRSIIQFGEGCGYEQGRQSLLLLYTILTLCSRARVVTIIV